MRTDELADFIRETEREEVCLANRIVRSFPHADTIMYHVLCLVGREKLSNVMEKCSNDRRIVSAWSQQ